MIFENKNKVLDSVQTSLGSWGNARIGQQVLNPLPKLTMTVIELMSYRICLAVSLCLYDCLCGFSWYDEILFDFIIVLSL